MIDSLITPRFIDVIVAFMVIEVAAIGLWHRRRNSAETWRGPALMIAPGIFLFLALRCALTETHPAWIVLCLTLALVSHLADLRERFAA